MPTFFKWAYNGELKEHNGEQRVFAGDRVYVDGMADAGVLVQLDFHETCAN